MSWMKEFDGDKHGPDRFLELVFEAADDARVRSLVKATGVPGGVHRAITGRPMQCEFRALETAEHDLWIDDRNAELLFGNLDGTHSVNVWCYGCIEAGGGRVWFEHGYGDSALLEAGMRILAALTEPDAPPLRGWSIEYGGQGYPCHVLRAGTSAVSLRAYLGW